MKTNRRILFAKLTGVALQAFTLAAATVATVAVTVAYPVEAQATTTKVGNGDDGADLEALAPIKSGPIWESRKKAVELLERLNVSGVVGLGILVPELKATEMLMAKTDVRPTVERAGSIEISEDSRQVYARTFAEPYAATRFFPAAATLSTEQLIALHIHEALHRALPAEIREDENKVAHLTLALTSPGASFDRVSSVANLYLRPVATPNIDQRVAIGGGAIKAEQEFVAPPRSRTLFSYGVDTFNTSGFLGGQYLIHGIEGSTSLGGYRKIGAFAVEPYFRARMKADISSQSSLSIGVPSFEVQARTKLEEGKSISPFFRYTLKTLSSLVRSELVDRDVATLGVNYQSESLRNYLDATGSYSFGSSATSNYTNGFYDETDGSYNYNDQSEKREYGNILTLAGRVGLKRGKFRLGGVGEFHASQGFKWTSAQGGSLNKEPFRILALGPEIGFVNGRFSAKVHAKTIVNDSEGSFTELADLMDHGLGESGYGASFALAF